MLHRIALVLCALLGLALGTTAHAGDCYNDEVPLSTNDLEPPAPGSIQALLSVTDADVNKVLAEIADYERRIGARPADSPVTTVGQR